MVRPMINKFCGKCYTYTGKWLAFLVLMAIVVLPDGTALPIKSSSTVQC
jgi:hypothetical protein